jgi:hypothetical protein
VRGKLALAARRNGPLHTAGHRLSLFSRSVVPHSIDSRPLPFRTA